LNVGTILNGRFKLIELTLNHPILGQFRSCYEPILRLLINNFPNEIFVNRCTLSGIHYNAIGKKGENYVVKMDGEGNLLSLVRSEAGFLNAVLKACASQYFVDFVHGGRVSQMIYFVTQFRPGPSLNDCLCAMPEGKFTVATSCRVTYFILQAIEWVHKLNYLLRRVDPNVIKYDVEDRVIYLSDLSSVRVDPAKLNVSDVKVKWAGAHIYAPLEHHNGGTMRCQHDIEPLIYFLVEMTTGTLPWAEIDRDKVPTAKKNALADKSLFRNCPPSYTQMYAYISTVKDGNEIDYKQLYTKLEETWKAAGANSLTEPSWDWEQLLKTDES
uniref:Protein kinase domain-containing protein n=1 Tax=Toxocara canis TaxID=6265 RepID=A0A183USL9_TOXCA